MPRNLVRTGFPAAEMRRFFDEWNVDFVFGDVPAEHVGSLGLEVPGLETCIGVGIYAVR